MIILIGGTQVVTWAILSVFTEPVDKTQILISEEGVRIIE